MQVDHLGKQQRHQQVAVEELDDRVDHHHPAEGLAPAELEKGDQHHRDRHHGGADIGNDHRQAHQQAQQHRVVQPHQRKADVGRHPHHGNLHELAAHIAGDLDVELAPDILHQFAILGQETAQPVEDQVLVLEEEEHQQRHHDQVDEEGDDIHHRRQRQGDDRLPQLRQLAAKHAQHLLDLLLRHIVGIALGQLQQQLLTLRQHPRQFAEQLGQLRGQQRQQHQEQQQDGSNEQRRHQARGNRATDADAFQLLHPALEQVGDHHADQDRSQVLAEEKDQRAAADQDQRQDHGLRVGEVALVPAPENIDHGSSRLR